MLPSDVPRVGARKGGAGGSKFGGRVRWDFVFNCLFLFLSLTGASGLAGTFTVTSSADSGPGSLRQALLDANATVPGDTIAFSIPGAPPFKITPTSSLPSVTSAVILDGTTQPGFAGTPLIELDGSLAGLGVDGIFVATPGCIVRGLAVSGFNQAGIRLGSPNNLVEQCFVGTDITGTQVRGNGFRGIWVSSGAFNLIRSNLVSGNLSHGIDLGTSGTNRLEHNFIGTDVTGTQPLGNREAGVFMSATSLGPPLANRIGGTNANEGNTIAFNGMVGVFVSRSARNAILGNSIFANAGIGIDLSRSSGSAEGPTRNDDGDFDSGGNLLQNFPVITQVNQVGGNTVIAGSLNSAPSTGYRLEFFSNPNPAPKFAFSEGRDFIGFTNVTTDGSGNASFLVSFPGVATNITATATDPDNNSSEFSTLNLPLSPATPQPGDIYVSVDGSRVQWRRADGTPVKELRTGAVTASSPAGLALDRQGNLFATTLDGRSVVKFDAAGEVIATNTSGILFNTLGVRLDAFDNLLVGLDNGDLLKFNPAGVPVNTFSFGSRLVFDLAADQQTLFYSPFVNAAHRYDLANELPLANFVSLSGPQLRDIQILADGQVLIANGNYIVLLSASGQTNRLYGQSTVPRGWGALRVLPDGQSFWAAGDGPFLNRFDLNTGELLDRLYIEYQIDPLNFSGQQLATPSAFAIRGGFTAGNGGVALATVDDADPVSAGGTVTYALSAANNASGAIANVTVTNTFPAGSTFSQATATQGTFSQGGGQVVFSLGTLAAGATVNLTVTVTTAVAGTITNSARLSGTGLDAGSPDYLSIQTTLVVNGPASPTTVFTGNDAGAGSLRHAIQAANNAPGANTITFNIPGSGVRTIRPLSALPLINSPVTIDGYTQSGAQPNSAAQGFNGTLLIELDGSQISGSAASGLTFLEGSGGSVVRGLVINRFPGSGLVLLQNTSGSRVEGNFIGTDPTGLLALPNNTGGINLNNVSGALFGGGSETFIGGVTPETRNLISGNHNFGVSLFASLPSLVRIKGNYIGTDRTGLAALPNNGTGISVSAPDCEIGGTEPGAGNVIAFNEQAGVTLGGRADGVPILRNSIHSNGAPGITGSFVGPQLTGASPGGAVVSGFLQGAPSQDYAIEVFANDACDPGGFGQGQTYLGSANTRTDPSGNASFTVPVSPALVAGQFISATATDENDDTSLFSRCLQVGPSTDLSVSQSVSMNPLPAGSNVVFDVTVSNGGPVSATGVFLSWTMPKNFTFVSGSAGVQNSGGRVTASAASLSAGATMNWSITVRPKQIGSVVSTFAVVGDQPDQAPGDNLSSVAYNIVNPAPRTLLVTSTNASGAGTLYQAILDVNTGPGGDTIAFNISGAGVRTIQATFLPGIDVPVTIDGFTQPGSKANALPVGNDAVMLIELSGTGLELYGGFSTVRGMVINNARTGIYLGDPDNVVPSRSNVVEGCFLGVNSAGTLFKPNNDYGIAISGSRGDRIGGSAPSARNVISGNSYAGIGLLDQAFETVIQGNYIGSDASGTLPRGNKAVGVYAEAGSEARNLIGGPDPGQGNLIAFNGGPGVLVYLGNGNAISGNSIFGNGGIGINLGGEGSVNDAPPTNDAGDVDIGANDLQNAPVITQVTPGAGSTRIQGTLNSLPNRLHRLEFFSSPTNPAAFYLSEGKTYLGSSNVTTDGSGNAAFDVTLPQTSEYVSATATDPDGNTSPFFTFGYQAPAACFQAGDLLTGYGDGSVQWRRADGRPVRVLRLPDVEATGIAFDGLGQLFVTGYQQGQIHQFDPCGNALSPMLTGNDSDPESILFEGGGDLLVGFVNATQNIRRYGPAGNLLSQSDVGVEFGGADWIDLGADGQTLYYTSEGTRLKRFNLATSQQLPDLATNLLDAAGVRVLPDGSVIVATRQNLEHRDALGNLLRNFSYFGIFFWKSVNLDADGVSFWSVGGEPPRIVRFNIATGVILAQIPVDVVDTANSLAVMGEFTVAGGSGSVRPVLSVTRDGTDVLLSWPEAATSFYLEYSPSIGAGANWQSNAIPPTVGGGQKTVRRDSVAAPTEYFRLRRP